MPTRSLRALAAALLLVLWVSPAIRSPLYAAQPPAAVEGQRISAFAVPGRAAVAPGDQFAVAIVYEFEEGWHAWPNKPILPKELDGLLAIPSNVALAATPALPSSIRVVTAAAQWPEPHPVATAAFGTGEDAKPLSVFSLSGRGVVYIPVILAPDAPKGSHTIPLTFSLQACNDSTCIAEQTLSLPVTITIADAASAPDASGIFNDFNPAVFARILSGEIDASSPAKSRQFDFLGYTFQVPENAFLLIFALAFAAGILMNFTPCVLPVIPIKILSIQSHANSPGKLAWFGAIYCLGIVTLYLILGLMAYGLITGGKKFDWGQIFTIPWFVIAMSLIIAVMGVGMMGLFTIRLPNAVYMVNPTGETALGNFIGGLLTGVLAVPCTGPLLGATLAWIFTQPPAVGLLTFVTMGLGMAFPYALLIAFPRLVSRMPRGGPGGELLKQVIGLFLVAVAAYLAGNLTSARWPWWIVGALCLLACAWWGIGAIRTLRSPTTRTVNAALATLAAFAFGLMTWSVTRPPPIDWRHFENDPDAKLQAAIADAVAKGNVVVVDFTAKWCVNCHVIEKSVLYSDTGLEVFKQPGVLPFKVDLTSAGDDQGWGTVRKVSGGGGIPLIAVFGPANPDAPIYFQSFFKPADLKDAVARARGRG